MAVKTLDEEALFHAARRIASAEDRAQFLRRACGDDAGLAERVRALLKMHEQEPSQANEPGLQTSEYEPVAERAGSRVGPYTLREQIGEGGFGLVFVAEQQQPVRRKVALKIIKPGMDSKQVVARFEAERQALAMMDHVNIAKVFDAGMTETGRPYFVMELVHGVPITEYCDANKLTPRQRLELFVPVCQAIQHAHQKGIIHRDVKPSNILVTMYDDKPVPKVIDFGVAKAVEQRLTEKSIYTQFGALVGTFEYMSPEQAEMNAFGVDTRSDIYALGVLLFELLTGSTPLERPRLREAAFNEIVRLIKEEEPPKPSHRLSTTATLTKVAAARQTEPGKLSRLIRGELDWVVMKCLEKDRSRRYDTASALARDVEHYLKDEPVEACPPSLTYRFRKMTRRNRGMLITAAAFAAVLVLGAAISIWQAVTATKAEHRATVARQDAELAFMDADLARREAVEAKGKAESASARLKTAMKLTNEGHELYYQGHRAEALQKHKEALALEDDLSVAYVYRKMIYVDLGLWDKAAADYAWLFRNLPRQHFETFHQLILLQDYVGNTAGYREACQEFVRQYGESTNPAIAGHVLHACCLTSDSGIEKTELIRRAEALAKVSDTWQKLAAATAFLRVGNYSQVMDLCGAIPAPKDDKPETRAPRLKYALQAIALHRLGRTGEARETLATLNTAIDGCIKTMLDGPVGTLPVDWPFWLQILHWRREATITLTGSEPPEDKRLKTLRERGIEVTNGDVYTYMAVGRKAVERNAWDEAVASYVTAIDKMPLTIPRGPAGRHFLMEMVQQEDVFEKLVAQRPQWDLWFNRGHVLAGRRDWPQAAKHYTRGIELFEVYAKTPEFKPTSPTGPRDALTFFLLHLADAKLLAGDEKGYLKICERIQREADLIDGPTGTHHASRLLSLSPAERIDRAAAVRLSEKAITKAPYHWFHYGLGLAYFRACDYEKARAKLEEHLKVGSDWEGIGQDYAVLAMTCHRLNRPDNAREWLEKAKTALADMEKTMEKARLTLNDGRYMNNWLELLILHGEAEKLLAAEPK